MSGYITLKKNGNYSMRIAFICKASKLQLTVKLFLRVFWIQVTLCGKTALFPFLKMFLMPLRWWFSAESIQQHATLKQSPTIAQTHI